MTVETAAITNDGRASAYLLKDSTTGNSADFVLKSEKTWIFLDVREDPDESARVIIDLPADSIIRAFRASGFITVKYRTQFTPTSGSEATADYATIQGGSDDVSNCIFAVTDGNTVRLYTRTAPEAP